MDMNLKNIVNFFLTLSFLIPTEVLAQSRRGSRAPAYISHSTHKVKWRYEAFPLVRNSGNDMLPSQLKIGRKKINSLLARGSATHRLFGVEQVYANAEWTQKVFVKKNVKLSPNGPIGGWEKIARGHVLHLKTQESITAFYVEGFNPGERFDIEKQIRQTYKSVSVMDLIIPKAQAEVTTGTEHPNTSPAETPVAGGASEEVCDNFATCLAKKVGNTVLQAGEDAWASTKSAAQSAYDDPWGAAKVVGGYAYDAGAAVVNAPGAIAGAAIDAGTAVGNYAVEAYKDPNKIYNDVSAVVDKTKKMAQYIYNQIKSTVAGMSPAVIASIMCILAGTLIAEIGMSALMTAVTGGAGAAKVALTIAKYLKILKPAKAVLAWLSKAKDLTASEVTKKIEELLSGKLSKEEIAKMEKAAAEGEKAAEQNPDAVTTASLKSMTPDQLAKTQAANRALSDDKRIAAIEKMTGTKLTDPQKKRLLEIHNTDCVGTKCSAKEIRDVKSMAEVQKMFPNMSPQKVKDLYRSNLLGRDTAESYKEKAMADWARGETHNAGTSFRLAGETEMAEGKYKQAGKTLEQAGDRFSEVYNKNPKAASAIEAREDAIQSYLYSGRASGMIENNLVTKENAKEVVARMERDLAYYAQAHEMTPAANSFRTLRLEQARKYIMDNIDDVFTESEQSAAFVRVNNAAAKAKKYGFED